MPSDNGTVHKFNDDSNKIENVEIKKTEKENFTLFNISNAIEIENKKNNEPKGKKTLTDSRDDDKKIINNENMNTLSNIKIGFDVSNDKVKKLQNNNYYQFENFKEYYLKCPDCKNYILKIVSTIFDNEQEDYLVVYKCFCNKKNEKYFYQILSEIPNYCENHKNQISIYYCEICNLSFCERCKNEHKEHIIQNILDKEVINNEIIKEIIEKKEEFKGTKVIQKLYDFYKSDKNKNIHNQIKDKENIYIIGKNTIPDKNEEYKDIIDIKNVKPNNENLKENVFYENIKTLRGHEKRVAALVKLSNNLIASGSEDATVKIWDINGKNYKYPIMTKNSYGGVLCLLEFEPGMLLGGTKGNVIILWNLNDQKTEEINHYFIQHEKYVNALVKCDENHFASASNDKKIIIWDYKNKKYKSTLERHTKEICDLIMLDNGYLCSAGFDNYIIIWDWKKAKCLRYFKPHKEPVRSLCKLNNNLLITGSEDKTIGVWDKNYKNIIFLKGHTYLIRSLCQIDDDLFASGSFDNTVKIWDLNECECIDTLKGHQSNVTCVIKYNDKILISCSCDNTIKIWEKNRFN